MAPPTLRSQRLALVNAVRRPTVSSRFVTRVDALRTVERELVLLDRRPGDRFKEEGVVVAGVEAREHATDEPVLAAREDRDALGAFAPLAAGELVDLVAGLAAEQLGEVAGIGGDGVHAERVRVLAEPERAVLVRQTGDEARRVDARLGREAHEAAERARGGEDGHRVLDLTAHAFEVAHAFSSTPCG